MYVFEVNEINLNKWFWIMRIAKKFKQITLNTDWKKGNIFIYFENYGNDME